MSAAFGAWQASHWIKACGLPLFVEQWRDDTAQGQGLLYVGSYCHGALVVKMPLREVRRGMHGDLSRFKQIIVEACVEAWGDQWLQFLIASPVQVSTHLAGSGSHG